MNLCFILILILILILIFFFFLWTHNSYWYCKKTCKRRLWSNVTFCKTHNACFNAWRAGNIVESTSGEFWFFCFVYSFFLFFFFFFFPFWCFLQLKCSNLKSFKRILANLRWLRMPMVPLFLNWMRVTVAIRIACLCNCRWRSKTDLVALSFTILCRTIGNK